MEIYRRFLDGRTPGVAIRFEDLLSAPEETLTKVCNGLGVPFAPEMLRGTDHPGMISDYRQSDLDRTKLEVTPLPEDAVALIEDDLRFCGYVGA